MAMDTWRKNLWLLVATQIVLRAAMSLIKPFLPLYLPEIGVTAVSEIAFWSGILSSINFVGQAIFSPVWGRLADRYGRKAMVVRSTVFIAVFNVILALVSNVYEMAVLRFIMGAMAGFNAAAIALVATTTPEEHLGYSLGMIQTGQMAGNIFGPALGGVLAGFWGYRGSFVAAGIMSLVMTFVIFFGVDEDRNRLDAVTQEKTARRHGLRLLTNPGIAALFIVIIFAQFGLQSSDSLIPLYISTIYHGNSLNFVVALAFAGPAVVNLFMAPVIGRWGDKNGNKSVLVFSLIGMGLVLLPQAVVSSAIWLIILRCLAGLFTGGVLPSVQALLGHMTVFELRGLIFGLAASATAIGNFLGPMMGGVIASKAGISPVFVFTGIGMFCAAVLVLGLARSFPNKLTGNK